MLARKEPLRQRDEAQGSAIRVQRNRLDTLPSLPASLPVSFSLCLSPSTIEALRNRLDPYFSHRPSLPPSLPPSLSTIMAQHNRSDLNAMAEASES